MVAGGAMPGPLQTLLSANTVLSGSSLHLGVRKGRGGQTWAKKKRQWSAPRHTMFACRGGHSGVDSFQQQEVLAGETVTVA